MPRWKRCLLIPVALLMGSAAGTQVFAVQAAYHPSLGTPLATIGSHRLYQPLAGWRWAWRWGRQVPGRFQWAALALLSTTALLCLPLTRRVPARPNSARWGTAKDLQQMGLFAPYGIVLGKCQGRIVRHNGLEHVLCVAPTQSGKTTSIVIPTILSWPGSVLVHDPKEELHARTGRWRGTMSRVIHFQPTSLASDCYNPFDAIRLGTQYDIRDTQIVAEMLVDPDGEGEHGGAAQHFRDLAMTLHTGLILHGLLTGQATCPGSLQALLASRSFPDLVVEMQGNPHPAVQWAASTVDDLADRELSGVLSTARRALRLWVDPVIARATAHSDFTLHDLREAALPLSLYLSVPFGDQERLRPLTRLLVRQLLDYCTHTKTGWRHRLLGLIDEAPGLKRLAVLEEGSDYFAGFGVVLCLITPSMNSMVRLYGRHNNFIEGFRYKVVFGLHDDEVARKFSGLTGDTDREKQRESVAHEPGNLFRERTTTSTETVQHPLLSETELLNLPDDQLLLLIGNRPPVLLEKARYFEYPLWKEKVCP